MYKISVERVQRVPLPLRCGSEFLTAEGVREELLSVCTFPDVHKRENDPCQLAGGWQQNGALLQ